MTTDKYIFKIGELSIPYTVTESTKAKHIRLIIDIEGLRVVKPKQVAFKQVESMIHDKSAWIYKHYMPLQSKKTAQYKRKWETGEKVLYKGEAYPIKISPNLYNSAVVTFSGDHFEVYTDEKVENRQEEIANAFRKWYIDAAYKTIEQRVDDYCKIIGVSYHKIKIKEQKTRWGSCSKKGNLNFNWKLIMAPKDVLDYVIVHEVCHLRHLNHGAMFWQMVANYMPNYQKARKWLKENGVFLSFHISR